MPRPRIVMVFVKLPVAGRVKTRIAAGLQGPNPGRQAVEIYKKLVSKVFETLSQSPIDHVYIAYDPPKAEIEIQSWLKESLKNFPDEIKISFHPQASGDLGDRLQTAINNALTTWINPKVAAIGTDCVEITPDHFSETWEALESNDLVFGPTFDGGYYLVATQSEAPEIFTDIPWSTEETLRESIASAQSKGRSIFLLTKQNDVDTIEDWEIARKCVSLTGRD